MALLVAVVLGIVLMRGSGSDTGPDGGAEAAPSTITPSDVAPSPTVADGSAGSTGSAADADGGEDGGEEGTPYCGPSRYVEEITVQRWADGRFRISVRPTPEARDAKDREAATAEIWQAVRRCVTEGLDGEVGESLHDQLRCHEYLAWVPGDGEGQYATGETYDLESWRPKAGRGKWISTRCGNTLGTDPTSPPVETYRPDGVPPQHTVSGEQA